MNIVKKRFSFYEWQAIINSTFLSISNMLRTPFYTASSQLLSSSRPRSADEEDDDPATRLLMDSTEEEQQQRL